MPNMSQKITVYTNMSRHAKCHDGEKAFNCEQCGKSFTRSFLLKEHSKIHDEEKPLNCRFCSRTFKWKNHKRMHEQSHFDGEGQLDTIKTDCETCGKSFQNKSSLKLHQAIHENKRALKCEVCDKGFNQAAGLRKHKQTRGVKINSCSVRRRASESKI